MVSKSEAYDESRDPLTERNYFFEIAKRKRCFDYAQLVTTFAFYSLRKILNFIFARSFLFLENLLGFLDCSLRSRKNISTVIVRRKNPSEANSLRA